MKTVEFIKLVKEMRITQKEYFKSGKNFSVLDKARALERKVDAEIQNFENPTLGL